MFTVYIVDDDRNLCRCLEQLVPWKEYGYYTPLVCHQGEEALEKMKRRPPDLLITDLKMPVMGGAELCVKVRERFGTDVDVIFLSAYEDFTTARLAIVHGVKDYILKPLDPDNLNELKKLVREASDRCLGQSHAEKPWVPDPEESAQNSTLYAIYQQVKAHMEEPDFSVSRLADTLHLSAGYLGRIFSKETGMGLAEYIGEERLKRAMALLTDSNQSIQEVAVQSGYANVSYFNRIFRAKLRMSPSEYRRRYYQEKLKDRET